MSRSLVVLRFALGELLAGRRLPIVAALVALPLWLPSLLAPSSGQDPTSFGLDLFRKLVVPVLLPVVSFAVSTDALGNERLRGTAGGHAGGHRRGRAGLLGHRAAVVAAAVAGAAGGPGLRAALGGRGGGGRAQRLVTVGARLRRGRARRHPGQRRRAGAGHPPRPGVRDHPCPGGHRARAGPGPRPPRPHGPAVTAPRASGRAGPHTGAGVMAGSSMAASRSGRRAWTAATIVRRARPVTAVTSGRPTRSPSQPCITRPSE